MDSSERSFGRTFVSNELLIAVTYKHSRKSSVTMEMSDPGRLILTHLCNRELIALIVSIPSVSVRSVSITVDGCGRRVPDVVDVLLQLLFQHLEELSH